jgi:hypothetical protein
VQQLAAAPHGGHQGGVACGQLQGGGHGERLLSRGQVKGYRIGSKSARQTGSAQSAFVRMMFFPPILATGATAVLVETVAVSDCLK